MCITMFVTTVITVFITWFISCVYNIVIDSFSERLKSEGVEHPWLIDKKKPVFIAAGMLEKQTAFPTLESSQNKHPETLPFVV